MLSSLHHVVGVIELDPAAELEFGEPQPVPAPHFLGRATTARPSDQRLAPRRVVAVDMSRLSAELREEFDRLVSRMAT